jgi:hypothetical protein
MIVAFRRFRFEGLKVKDFSDDYLVLKVVIRTLTTGFSMCLIGYGTCML